MNDDQGVNETASPKELVHNAGSAQAANRHKPTIVGIGASAGGLNALKIFFSRVPSNSNLAFVVVVHLSPQHESHLPDLLQPHVKIPVEQVTATISLEANHVYVIPPNANLSAIDTHLRLSELEKERRERAPIDHFFRTLAATHDGDSVGVVLTGTGSDGTLGVKDIKAKGGLIIVQDPNEAEFDGMPQSAIATGLVDWILPLADIPDAIIRFDRTQPKVGIAEPDGDEIVESADKDKQTYLQKIFAQIRARADRDFSRYKQSTILRRISRRMQLSYIDDLPTYIEKLRSDPDEVKALADDCLITVTSFFRDPEVFERLEKDVIPRLFKNRGPKDTIRVWSVGCATGEEAYSLAIVLAEEAARHDSSPRIQIFASDLHKRSLERGREGLYSGDIETDVRPNRLRRFFQKENGGYRVQKDIRDLVVFSPHNLLGDPPFSRIDIITCRNLLIYLQRHAQRDVIELFHYSLNPEGTLVLGTAEILEPSDLFRTEDKKLCFYRKRNVPVPEPRLPVFPLLTPRQSNREVGIAANSTEAPPYGQLHQKLLELYAPPSILVGPDDKVVHLSENAGRYLVPPGGEVTTTAYKLVRDELRLELRTLLQAARQNKIASESQPISVQFDGHARPVVMRVRPSPHPDHEGFRLVIFDEHEWGAAATPQPHTRSGPVRDPDTNHAYELEKELAVARQRTQALVEEYETSREEMQASGEEMQSANEELRSTMEELETSKEELQSINEELQTVNQENRHKVEELAQLSSDLQNLLTATEIATLFLDRELRILRFTPKLAELFNVRVQDRGRPISDLTHRLGYLDLRADAEAVLSRLVTLEREIKDEEGHWFLTRVLPYRSAEDRILGVVITFFDITARRNAEETLLLSEERLRGLVTATSYSIYRMSPDWTEMRQLQGQGFLFDTTEPNSRWLDKYILPDDQPQVIAAIQRAIGSKSMFALEHRIRRLDGSYGWTLSRAVPLLDADGEVMEWFGAASDVTARKEADARQVFLLQLSDALRPLADTAEIQSVACQLLGDYLGAQRAYYTEIHEADGFAVVEHDYVSGGLPTIARRYALSDFGWVVPLYKQGRTIVVTDVRTSPLVPDADREAMVSALVISWIAVPLVKHGELAGALCLAEGEPRKWTQTEIELTQETAERIWAAIERTRAETALRVSEEKYRSLFERMAQGYAEIELVRDGEGRALDHRFLQLNPAFERLTGVSASAACGRLARDVFPGLEFGWTEMFDKIVRGGKPERIEYEAASLGRWYEVWVYPGSGDRFTELYEDITERKRAEAVLRESTKRQSFLLNLADALRPLGDPVAIQEETSRLLGNYLEVSRVLYVEFRVEAGREFVVVEREHRAADVPSFVGYHPAERFGTDVADLRAGRVVAVADSQAEAETEELRGGWRALGVRARLNIPLVKDGRLVAGFCVHDAEARAWTAEEIALVHDTAERTWTAVERARAEAALRKSEEQQAFLLRLSDALRPLLNPIAIEETASQLLGEHLGVERAAYAELEPGDQIMSVKRDWRRPGAPSVVGQYRIDDFGQFFTRPLREGGASVIEDALDDPRVSRQTYAETWGAIHTRAAITYALVKQSRFVGAIFVHESRPRRWSDQEIALVSETGERIWDAMARAHVEVALRESEARARALIANLPGGAAFVIDHDLRYQLAGGEALVEAGFTTEAFVGHRLDEVLPPELVEEHTPHFRRALAGEPFVIEHEAHRRMYLSRGVPLRNDQGQVYASLVVSYDITERKRTEAALRESEERQRTLLEGMPQLVWRSHDNGEWTWASPQWMRFTGQGQEESLGHGWLNAVYPDDREPAKRDWAATAVQGQLDMEYRVRRASDGVYFWHHSRAVPVRNQQGQVVEWLGTSTDIEQLKQAEAARREAEEKFRLFADNVHEYALVQTDREGSIMSWNPGAQRLFGYDSEHMQGQDFSVLFTPQDEAEGVFRRELAVVASGQRHEDARWMVRQDSSRFWARWISEPIYDQTGRFRGVAKIMRDETEREKVEAFTRQSLTEKQELLKEVHHRVKNNLQVIVSLLNMQTRQIQDERVLALFQETRNRVLAISTIHELLYRAESFASIALVNYARQLVPGLVRFYDLEQRVKVKILGDGATLELERAVPYGMLLNELVSNACKHAFPPPHTGTITISLQPDASDIELVVADTGQGLPDDFDYQKATSLGLKLVHGLVRQLRGTLQIESELGTTVRVRFPATSADTGL